MNMATELPTRPLVSFLVIAYRQERFIAEAVRSALAQAGAPIQIILSDDASPDGTFEVMKDIAVNYRGPHQVILNRNPANLGLAGHINRAWQLSTGEFVILQAGDDISVPERSEKLVRRWLDSGRKLDLVCSYFEEISEDGHPTGFVKKQVVFVPDKKKDVSEWRCGATGACAAYSRKLYEKFGPMDPNVAAEDWVYSFRAWLVGGIGLVEEPLVKHRTHGAAISVMARNISKEADRQTRFLRRRKMQAGTLAIAEEWLKAWRIAKKGQDAATERDLEKLVCFHRAQLEAYEAPLASQLRLLPILLRHGGMKAVARHCVRHVFGVY